MRPHLRLNRERPTTERRRPGGFPPSPPPPQDPQVHGASLHQKLRSAREKAAAALGGYDQRRLIKLKLATQVSPEALARISPGMEAVSQEGEKLILYFATDDALETFEAKLSSLSQGEAVTRKDLLYALSDIDHWSEDDRTGRSLKQHGLPPGKSVTLDVELWPLDSPQAPTLATFSEWLKERGGKVLDKVKKAYLVLCRVRCDRAVASDLLRHRDVRTIELPPRLALPREILSADVQNIPEVEAPLTDAPAIVVLDSGLASGHPLLAPAVGDSQSFLPGRSAADEHGHGTLVSGIALYGDVAKGLRAQNLVPELRLFSGRILDEKNQSNEPLVENQIEDAVRYFADHYGCRVFNLSYGDPNRSYEGGRITGLAVTLDALSRELGVLFVVPTGNYEGGPAGPGDWREDYPDYLSESSARLLDPAPALNALTVGSLARWEKTIQAESYSDDPAYQPIARTDEPSPFTRSGPSVRGAIKPDLVDYGGNRAVDLRTGSELTVGRAGIGERSTSRDFAAGSPFAEGCGTSFAAPRVAHVAARLLRELPGASANLCRALLVAHARTPLACAELFSDDRAALRRITGYGLIDRSALYRSPDDCVSLWATESMTNNRHHFYELPVPDEFWSSGRRERRITVALAYFPAVRTTRIDYRAAKISFKLVQAQSLDEVASWFSAVEDNPGAAPVAELPTGRNITEQNRSKGTVQASSWTFTVANRSRKEGAWFVVVTRNDPAWGQNISNEHEEYALVATIADRQFAEARLYSQIQVRLRQRARARASDR